MKYVLMFCETPGRQGEVDEATARAVHDDIWAWFGVQEAAGRIAHLGAHLQPPTTATTVRGGEGDAALVVDGPFSESKEVVGGFTIVEAPDLDTVLAMARTWPALRLPGTSVEVRPVVAHDGDA